MEESAWMMGTWSMIISVMLTGIGGLGIFSSIAWIIYEYIRQNHVVSFTINTTQPCYEWIILWLKKHGPLSTIQHLTLVTKRDKISWYSSPGVDENEDEKRKKMEYSWSPRPISHFFKHYKTGQWILINISRDEKQNRRFWDEDSTGGSIKEFESLTLSTFGTSTKIWEDLLSEAKAEFAKQSDGKTVVYRYNKQGELWKVFGKPKDKRPWKTIVTQDNIKQAILEDIKLFKSSEKEYKTLGMPYRRGYLLHGPPGTGKSSLVYGLAGELDVSICVLTLSDKDLSDDEFMNRLAAAPKNSIILLEDIDVALPSEKRKMELEVKRRRTQMGSSYQNYSGSLTMSGVLNGIDGVTTVESQIIIMTTNHKDNLDQALIRPGRVDKTFYLDNCNSTQVKEMFRNFFTKAKEKEVERMGHMFQNMKSKSPVSPATFENYLSQFKGNAREAIGNINVLEQMIESDYNLRYNGKTIVYRYSEDGRKWDVFGKPRAKRPWKSVVTQNNIKDNLLEDIERFQQKEKCYHDRGIPYRCGYLLHGPPGTGKSSLAYSIAGKLDYGICVLSFTDKQMTDDDLMRRLASIPTKCIVLIEDIDVALPSQKRQKDIDTQQQMGKQMVKTNLTLSGVLNAIDGVESVESQILIMTTNFKKHLEPALIRPGRVDKEFYLGNCDIDQAKCMFCNFLPAASKEDVDKMGTLFEKIKMKNPVSPAAYENYLSRFETNANEALDNIHVLEESLESEVKGQYIDKTTVYRYCNDERKWKLFGKPRTKRHWKSIVTQNGIKENLLEDVELFHNNEQLYHDHGIPLRRGYLLYGPTGTGKSSLVYSLAGKLDYGICLLNLSDKDITDENLMQRLGSVPNKCIVFLENIDVVLPSRKRKNELKVEEKENGQEAIKRNLTTIGVGNAIDSFESEASQILIMTANDKENVDSAIIQPGRVDVEFYLGNCSGTQIKDMFRNIFPSAKEDEINKMMQICDKNSNQKIKEDPISPAQFHRYLFRFSKSPSDALNNVNFLKEYLEVLSNDSPASKDSGCSDNE